MNDDEGRGSFKVFPPVGQPPEVRRSPTVAIEVRVFEGESDLIARKVFTDIDEALAWIKRMGLAGVWYRIS